MAFGEQGVTEAGIDDVFSVVTTPIRSRTLRS
jgi:hypothetical protein